MVGIVDVIRTLKYLSAFALVAVVIAGTTQYDPRFTMLLVPPFIVWWAVENGGLSYLEEMPVIGLVGWALRRISDTFGPTGFKFFLATLGFAIPTLLFQDLWK